MLSFFSSCLKIFEAKKLSVSLVKAVVVMEVSLREGGGYNGGDEPSASSAVFSRLCLRWAREFLKESIGSAVHQVVQGNLRLEIEAAQLRSVDNLLDNAEQLVEKSKSIVEVRRRKRTQLVGF